MHITLKLLSLALIFACVSIAASAAEDDTAADGTTEVAKTDTVKLDVTGMTCGGCVAKVQKGLDACDGVSKCTINFDKGTAVVEVKSGTAVASLIKAVKTSGFEATETKKEVKEEEETAK